MKNILILGSLPEDEKRKNLYLAIKEICEIYAEKVSTPIETAEFEGSVEERYERAFKKVREADLIIGEQTKPSTGQGMEMREAANRKIPLFVVAEKGSKVSGLVKGCPVLQKIIYYKDINDLKMKLQEYFLKQ